MNNDFITKTETLSREINLSVEFIFHQNSGKTSNQATKALGVDYSFILKTLILFAPKEFEFFGVVFLSNDMLDIKKIISLVNVKKIVFASDEQVYGLTGFYIGGVPPLAIKFCKCSFIDKKVINKPYVIGSGGDEYCGLKFNPYEFVEKAKITVVNLVR